MSLEEPAVIGDFCGLDSCVTRFITKRKTSMKNPTVILNGVNVRIESAGRYHLNDLHRQGDMNHNDLGNFSKVVKLADLFKS